MQKATASQPQTGAAQRQSGRRKDAVGFSLPHDNLAQLAQMIHQSPRMQAERSLMADIHNSPYMVAQRRQLEGMFGWPMQRKGIDEEEPLQALANEEELDAVQRQAAEEEDLVQGKFTSAAAPVQLVNEVAPKENNTGLPDNLKSGVEHLSGIAMDDVKVHYNSSKPAQLQALAYAQGTDIHVAPGQEQHLPHEAWHVAQQKQGRIKPTLQLKGTAINDDEGLEREADVMGAKASALKPEPALISLRAGTAPAASRPPLQRVIISGPDSNLESERFKNKGVEALLSPMEIQNQITILQQKHPEMKCYALGQIAETGVQYDPVNYLVGHAEHDRGFMGKQAGEMASILKQSGLHSGHNGVHLILLACNSASFAGQLQAELKKLDIYVVVTGAAGLAYEYSALSGRDADVTEQVFDDKNPQVGNRATDEEIKLQVVRKYDNSLLNEIIQVSLKLGVRSLPLFRQLSTMSLQSNATRIVKNKDKVQQVPVGNKDIENILKSIFKKKIKAREEGEEENDPQRAKEEEAVFENLKILSAYCWSITSRSKKGNYPLEQLLKKLEEILKHETSPETGDAVSRIRGAYFDYGGKAAHEYVQRLAQHMVEVAPRAVMNTGWVTHSLGGHLIPHKHWRDDVIPQVLSLGLAAEDPSPFSRDISRQPARIPIIRLAGSEGWNSVQMIYFPEQSFFNLLATRQASMPPMGQLEFRLYYSTGEEKRLVVQSSTRSDSSQVASAQLALPDVSLSEDNSRAVMPVQRVIVGMEFRLVKKEPQHSLV